MGDLVWETIPDKRAKHGEAPALCGGCTSKWDMNNNNTTNNNNTNTNSTTNNSNTTKTTNTTTYTNNNNNLRLLLKLTDHSMITKKV